jgi:hypothetical protein
MENRQRQLEEAMRNIDHDLSAVGSDAIQDILAQNARGHERLAEFVEEYRTNVSDSLAVLSQRFSERILEEREQYQQGLQYLSQRLDVNQHKEEAKENLAREWLRRSAVFSEFIDGQFDHERFQPGKLSKILQRIEFAQGNLAAGATDASLQISQQAFLDLSELHFELEQCVLEWQTEYERAQNAMGELLRELQLNSQVNAFDLHGQALPEQIDLDYWTNGKYRLVLDQCKQFATVLNEEDLSTQELKRTYSDVLPVLTEYFDAVVYEARLNALNSQLRMNIAERALEALENHGFQLNKAGYFGTDKRGSYTLQLENADGSQVSVEVLPVDMQTQELTNELVVITNHPYLKTEQEARLQWDELCRTFRNYNLNVSRPETQPIETAPNPNHVEQLTVRNQQRMQLTRRSDGR